MVSPRWLWSNFRPGELPIDERGIPPVLRGKVSAVVRNPRQAEDLVAYFGGDPSYCPPKPVVLLIPRLKPIVFTTNGHKSAAWFRDVCMGAWQEVLDTIRRDNSEMRFDYKDFPYFSMTEQYRKAQYGAVARLLRDPKNKLANPDRTVWQPPKISVVRP